MNNLPTTKQELDQAIQQGIETYMRNKQYNYSKIVSHQHNGTDTPKLPISSINESIALQGKGDGMLSPSILLGRKVNNEWLSGLKDPNSVYILPINVIYGFGAAEYSTFSFGDALPGTMVFFDNGLTLSGLYIKTINGWYGIQKRKAFQ